MFKAFHQFTNNMIRIGTTSSISAYQNLSLHSDNNLSDIQQLPYFISPVLTTADIF